MIDGTIHRRRLNSALINDLFTVYRLLYDTNKRHSIGTCTKALVPTSKFSFCVTCSINELSFPRSRIASSKIQKKERLRATEKKARGDTAAFEETSNLRTYLWLSGCVRLQTTRSREQRTQSSPVSVTRYDCIAKEEAFYRSTTRLVWDLDVKKHRHRKLRVNPPLCTCTGGVNTLAAPSSPIVACRGRHGIGNGKSIGRLYVRVRMCVRRATYLHSRSAGDGESSSSRKTSQATGFTRRSEKATIAAEERQVECVARLCFPRSCFARD